MPDSGSGDHISLGPCCGCGCEGPEVRNIMMLDKIAPVPGTGWGCVVCGLPNDGAIAVTCDDCAGSEVNGFSHVRYVCAGYAGDGVRVPLAGLSPAPFRHDQSKH